MVSLCARAEFGVNFGLNFQPLPDDPQRNVYFACGFPGMGNQSNQDASSPCGESMGNPADKVHPGYPDGDAWPYLVETWGSGDTGYWHMIIGDPAQGWAQEVYIHGPGQNVNSTQGGIRSPSDGSNAGRFQPLLHEDEGSGVTGNGTGNPNKIAIRLFVDDTDADGSRMQLDFVKGNFDKVGAYTKFEYKPKITQTLTMPGVMKTEFEIDMSNIKYSENNIDPQSFVMRQYNMELANPANGVPAHTFEFNTDTALLTFEPVSGLPAYLLDPTISPPPPPPGESAPVSGSKVRVDGGKYTWSGGIDASGKYSDSYSYVEGAYNVYDEKWRMWWKGSAEWSPGDPYPP